MEYPGSRANVFPLGSLTEDWRKEEDPPAIYSFLADVNAEEEEEEEEEDDQLYPWLTKLVKEKMAIFLFSADEFSSSLFFCLCVNVCARMHMRNAHKCATHAQKHNRHNAYR